MPIPGAATHGDKTQDVFTVRLRFPNKHDDGHVDVKVVSKQVGDRQARFKNRKALSRRRHDDTLVLADGQNGDWTPHGLRRTGATMMQALEVSLDVIDRCQTMCWPAPG